MNICVRFDIVSTYIRACRIQVCLYLYIHDVSTNVCVCEEGCQLLFAEGDKWGGLHGSNEQQRGNRPKKRSCGRKQCHSTVNLVILMAAFSGSACRTLRLGKVAALVCSSVRAGRDCVLLQAKTGGTAIVCGCKPKTGAAARVRFSHICVSVSCAYVCRYVLIRVCTWMRCYTR